MTTNPKVVFIPGDVSIDIPSALDKAIARIRPIHTRLELKAQPLTHTKRMVRKVGPAVRRLQAVPKKYHINNTGRYTRPFLYESKEDKTKRIKRELVEAGITLYGLHKSECKILPKVLHPDEHIEAIVYGQHRASSVMLVATNKRIIFVDKKPMALFLDEVSYEVVSGLEFEIHTLFATLILHTPVKNYDIRFANLRCAENFARHIESQRLERDESKEKPKEEILSPGTNERVKRYSQPMELKEDLAGYYWLPMEAEEEEIRSA